MDWTQPAALFLANLAIVLPLWIWNRAENRADMRHVDSQLDSIRELVRAIHQENTEMMKDFHGRLCTIEERNKK
jgi:hypothetical protein